MKKLVGLLILGVLLLIGCASYSPGHFVDDGGYTYIVYNDGTRYEMPSGGSESE